MKRIWCIILGLIPIINFWLQYYFSGKEKSRKVFQQHRICYWLDRIFIPINILFLFLITTISREIILLLGIGSLIINYVIHHLRSLEKNIKNSHLVNPHISKAGRVHMVFSSIEMLIIILILISQSQSNILHAELWLLAVFIGGLNYGAYRIHHKIHGSDLMTTILLWGAIIIKIVYLK